MESQFVRANGIDVHYREVGSGVPLLLLHGGVVSSNPLWGPHPFAYASHVDVLAKNFRVLALDTRGCGLTVHDGGPITFDVLADDVLSVIDALHLDRPAVCGFSEGAITATVVAIRKPESVRAIVNQSGYDMFDPKSRSFMMMRQMLGGSPTATKTDPAAAERFFQQNDQMRMTFEMLKKDHDGAQGAGYWKTYLALAFERTTQPPGYTFADFAKILAPMLLTVGDRDDFCPLEDGVTAYRAAKKAELAVLPSTAHVITRGAVELAARFLSERCL